MQRLTLDGKYADVMERILYNGVLSGISLSGDRFFYDNPLSSSGQHEREPWFICACCPPNVSRILASTLAVRIPGWAMNHPVPSDLYAYVEPAEREPMIMVNGEAVAIVLDKGYALIQRTWRAGDVVDLSLPMPVRKVVAHEVVEADRGRVAVERGPLVYCAEWPDNDGRVSNLVLADGVALVAEARPGLLGGVVVIKGDAEAVIEKAGRIVSEKKALTLIPYYAWANRGKGEMAVWLAREPGKVRISGEPD
jgi:DUF1680 family protein